MFIPGTLLETLDTGQRKLPGIVKFSLVDEEGVSIDVDLLAIPCGDDHGRMCRHVGEHYSNRLGRVALPRRQNLAEIP